MALDTAGIHLLADETELRAIIGTPTDTVLLKLSDRLNELTRQFIERSPFLCVATVAPDGGLDVSPRGDGAGFVRILDERTLLIPERPEFDAEQYDRERAGRYARGEGLY